MKQSPRRGKRIVSKREFVANSGKKAVLSSFGAATFLIGIACMTLTFAPGAPLMRLMRSFGMFTCFTGLGMLGFCSLALFYYGSKAVQDAIEMDAGVPLTRNNTADLPASDCLVRASEEPPQEQKSVLLRAAIQGLSTPPEEMIRASIGPQNTDAGHPGM